MSSGSSPRTRAVIVAVATLLGVALTARLGFWQLDRAAQKQALQQMLDERAVLPPLQVSDLARSVDGVAAQVDRRVEAAGRWVPGATVFLENRQMNGRTGFFVVTPLLPVDGSPAVLVQRGFVARDNNDRTRLPALPEPDGTVVRLRARIAPPPARLYEFAPSGSGVIRQNLVVAEYARETGLSLRPMSLQQLGPDVAGPGSSDLLQRDWPRPAVDLQRHYGYAFQWFALCALMAGLYVWFQLLRPRFARPGDRAAG